jgi:uncharacterized protein (TIGR02271 family)
MADVQDQGLVSLEDGGWQVADGEPDVRGWTVVSANHQKIGEVEDLLADPHAQKVRYLTVEVDDSVAGSSDRTMRIPIERARLLEGERTVVLDTGATNMRNFASAPAQPLRDDQIKLTRSAEELRIGKRRAQAGEVEVRKRVETERVSEPVTLRHEEVDVQRRPVSRDAASRDVEITAQEIRVPLTREEAVIEKRPVVEEELVISKRAVEEEETVQTDLRKERIDVERHDDVRGHDSTGRNRPGTNSIDRDRER